MRLVNINELSGNEIVAKTIIDDKFRQLIVKGTRYRSSFNKKLEELGIGRIYIDDEISDGVEVEDIISDSTRLNAQILVGKQLKKFESSNQISVNEFSKVAGDIVDEIMNSRDVIYDLQDIKINDNYTFQHCVNVCVLAVLTAVKLGVPRDKIKKMAIGCLLHDFGKVQIPNEILNKPGKLTADEYEEVKKHPIYGYEAFTEIAPISRIVILMHHERLDGSGYPLGKTSEEIYDLAKICAVCDVFDAMTSERPYKKPVPIPETLKLMRAMAGKHLDKRILDVFMENIAVYPVGSIVVLNNGLVGIIKKNNKSNMLKPKLKIIYDAKKHIKINHDLDLLDNPKLEIKKTVTIDKEGNFKLD
ncbi:MAG: HD-GYP domain-containing protein [Clostridia bacterium]|jgi:HD-GYP domain-containing protein (c-di-GMP phosphodiesterase class II)|nr:HD-GYP domain-containing protein [Clostridia bacterium]